MGPLGRDPSRPSSPSNSPRKSPMRMIVHEDAALARLGPLTQTRPVFELRCGSMTLLERQARCLSATSLATFVRPELARLCRFAWPDRSVNEPGGGGETVVVN